MTSEQVENWLGNRDLNYDMNTIKHKTIYDKYSWLFILNDGCINAYNLGCMYGECYDDNSEGIFDDQKKMQEWVQELNKMMEN
tara:strand:+ start:8931 stop:9179 length:249 start_codon:yes stop_codon:yes gene_type:complete